MKVIEDLQSQIDDKDRLMIAKDMVIDTVNDDLEDDMLSTQHILMMAIMKLNVIV